MFLTSRAEMTASVGRLAKSAIFLRISSDSALSERAYDHVGLDADPPQLVDGVLRRLGLQLAGVADVGHERQVDEHAGLRRPASTGNCRIASRKGSDSMSPTVPPISVMTTSASLASAISIQGFGRGCHAPDDTQSQSGDAAPSLAPTRAGLLSRRDFRHARRLDCAHRPVDDGGYGRVLVGNLVERLSGHRPPGQTGSSPPGVGPASAPASAASVGPGGAVRSAKSSDLVTETLPPAPSGSFPDTDEAKLLAHLSQEFETCTRAGPFYPGRIASVAVWRRGDDPLRVLHAVRDRGRAWSSGYGGDLGQAASRHRSLKQLCASGASSRIPTRSAVARRGASGAAPARRPAQAYRLIEWTRDDLLILGLIQSYDLPWDGPRDVLADRRRPHRTDLREGRAGGERGRTILLVEPRTSRRPGVT